MWINSLQTLSGIIQYCQEIHIHPKELKFDMLFIGKPLTMQIGRSVEHMSVRHLSKRRR